MSNIERDVARAPESLPFAIFIDINAPLGLEAEGLDKQWMQDIKRWMDRMPAPTAEEPDVYNALYVTNFAPHYHGGGVASRGEWAAIKPVYTRQPLEFDLTGMIDHALNSYLRVPEIGKTARSSSRGNSTLTGAALHTTDSDQAPAAVGLRNVRFCPSKKSSKRPFLILEAWRA
jgi:hypothetical protein